MSLALGERVRVALAPPRYIALPFAGIDISTSGVKAVRLLERPHGIVLGAYAEELLPSGAFADGEFANAAAIAAAIAAAAGRAGIASANAALPESKSYLFETSVSGTSKAAWRTLLEQRLDELIPLPPAEAVFDVIPVGQGAEGTTVLVGIGFARRVVDEALATFDVASVPVAAFEGETFAMARALLPEGDTSTTLLIDVGKTTTKLAIVADRIPRFATTIGIGGHAFTLAIQKHFGVTESEARKVKVERGIVPAPGNEDYLATMLSTVSAIRDEILRHLDYWQSHQSHEGAHEPVSRAVLAGGNATVRGLPEYLAASLGIPVAIGNVFTNFAPEGTWVPALDHSASLAYATAVGLALRDRTRPTHVP